MPANLHEAHTRRLALPPAVHTPKDLPEHAHRELQELQDHKDLQEHQEDQERPERAHQVLREHLDRMAKVHLLQVAEEPRVRLAQDILVVLQVLQALLVLLDSRRSKATRDWRWLELQLR